MKWTKVETNWFESEDGKYQIRARTNFVYFRTISAPKWYVEVIYFDPNGVEYKREVLKEKMFREDALKFLKEVKKWDWNEQNTFEKIRIVYQREAKQ